MKKISTVLVGSIATAHLAGAQTEINMSLKDIGQLGLDPNAVQALFQEQANIKLNWDETLKVRADEEGKEISFDTLDGISVVVPLISASGPFNKDRASR